MDQEETLLKTTDSVQPTLAPGWEEAAKVKVCAQDPVLVVLLSSGKVGMVETALAAKTGQGLLSSKTNRKGTLLIMVVLSHPSQTNMEVSMEEERRTSLQVHTEEPCNRHSIIDSPLQLISSSQTRILTGPSTSKVSIKTNSMEVALTLGSKR